MFSTFYGLRTFRLSSALATVPLLMLASTGLAEEMTRNTCRPLTEQNIQACCEAANRDLRLNPSDMRRCLDEGKADRLPDSAIGTSSGRVATLPPDRGGGTPPPGGGGGTPPPPDTPGRSNPGNDKEVGKAGESPNGNDFGTGSQGQGDLHAAGGQPSDPGSQGQGNGPPTDPGSQGQGGGQPADPGLPGQGGGVQGGGSQGQAGGHQGGGKLK